MSRVDAIRDELEAALNKACRCNPANKDFPYGHSVYCPSRMAADALQPLLDRLAQVEAERDGLRDKVESDFEIEAIHGWFGLTYANYLTLPRSILQSMPDEWQVRFVRMLNEMEEAIEGVVEWPEGGYRVQAINNTGRFVRDPVPPYNRGRTRLPLNPSTPRPPLVQEPEEGT